MHGIFARLEGMKGYISYHAAKMRYLQSREHRIFESDWICAELLADLAFFCNTHKHFYKNLE